MRIEDSIEQIERQQKRLDALYHRAAVHFGMSDNALWVLYELARRPQGCTQGELCRQCYYAKQTIHSTVSGFVRDGIAVLEQSGNARGKTILLTEAGKNLAARTAQKICEAERRAYAAVGQDALEAYCLVGERINDGMEAELERLFSEETQ